LTLLSVLHRDGLPVRRQPSIQVLRTTDDLAIVNLTSEQLHYQTK